MSCYISRWSAVGIQHGLAAATASSFRQGLQLALSLQSDPKPSVLVRSLPLRTAVCLRKLQKHRCATGRFMVYFTYDIAASS